MPVAESFNNRSGMQGGTIVTQYNRDNLDDDHVGMGTGANDEIDDLRRE